MRGQGPGRRALIAIVWRYLAATVFGIAANLSLYVFFVKGLGVYPPTANLAAALMVIGPRFAINKIWVWRHLRTDRIGFEAAVHVALTVTGLGLSTVVAWLLARAGAGVAVLAIGNVASFAVTWVLRFLVSHFYLFSDGVDKEPDQTMEPASDRSSSSSSSPPGDSRRADTSVTPP